MPRPRLRQPAPAGDPNSPPVNLNDLQHGTFPGDTVVVHDPPPSNMGTQDSYGEEKGIEAPPGARGEYTERPPGSYGGPGGSIGVGPLKYRVDYDDSHKRNQIPPMFLPAASRLAKVEEEIDNDDEPEDDAESKGITDYWREVLQPAPEGGPGPEPLPGGEPAATPAARPAAAPIPLVRLDHPDDQTRSQIYGTTGTLTPGVDTTEALRQKYLYNLDSLVQNPATTEQMLEDTGFRVEPFSFDPERFRLPKLKTQGYDKGIVWIYDPYVMHGSSKEPDRTLVWRTFHEVSHGVVEPFMQERYGPSKREGRLGAESETVRGTPPRQVRVPVRGLTLAEAQRSIEWEDVAFRTQRMLLAMYGVETGPREFANEYNVNIVDALYRVLTGDFGNAGEYGYTPGDTPANVRDMLAFLQAQEESIAQEQGRPPTPGIDLATWQPVSDDALRQALEQRIAQHRGRRQAFSVYPVPGERPPMDERLLLQIPHDVQERYSDLTRRVSEYVKNLKLNTLDMYSFPSDPPEKWVEEEKGNVQVDFADRDSWSAYMGRLSHDDVADWVGLEALAPERVAALAPNLHSQHALEAGTTQPFAAWFRSRSPAITDGDFVDYIRQTAQAFPSDGLGKGYSGYWRRRNHEMVREVATSRAKERHDRYLREVAYHEHVKPNYRENFDGIVRSRSEHMPLSDVVKSLHALPVDEGDRETVDGFRTELDGMVDEGMHALDFYREPVSRDDRLFGDMEYQGEKWVPVRRIEGAMSGGVWITPNGQLISAEPTHEDWAKAQGSSTEELLRKGWVRAVVRGSHGYNFQFVTNRAKQNVLDYLITKAKPGVRVYIDIGTPSDVGMNSRSFSDKDEAIENLEGSRTAAKIPLTFVHKSLSSAWGQGEYRPQGGGRLSAYDEAGQEAGYIYYAEHDSGYGGNPQIIIQQLTTIEKYRRMGVAADLVLNLRNLYPDAQFIKTPLTDEGSKFYDSADPESRQAAKIPLTFTEEDDQATMGRIWAYIPNAVPPVAAGLIEWVMEGKNEVLVAYLHVGAEYRRQGVALDLVQKLREKFPGKQINPGVMSDEGAALLRGADPSIKMKHDTEMSDDHPWRLSPQASVPIALYKYGNRYFPVHEADLARIDPDVLMIRAQVYAVTPGSSIAKVASANWDVRARALASAIREVQGGVDKEGALIKYGREYGPGLRKALSDYLFVTSAKKADGGPAGSSIGDSTCSSFNEQTPDNCGGCTFNPSGAGSVEFGYGDGGCLLSHLFLNAPEAGHGRGDPNAYEPTHTPGTPGVQERSLVRRTDPRRP